MNFETINYQGRPAVIIWGGSFFSLCIVNTPGGVFSLDPEYQQTESLEAANLSGIMRDAGDWFYREKLSLERIRAFFEMPGITKAGICKEAGISQQYLNRVLFRRADPSGKFLLKIVPAMILYGY